MAVFLHAVGFHCLTFDVRGHGANRARGAAAQRRRVRARHAGRARRAARPSGGDGGRPRRALDGRHRGDPRGRRGPADRGPRRELDAGGPVPPHAPDLPARPPADPRSDRLPPCLADDARLPAAPRPRGPRRQRLGCDRPVPRPGAACARRRRTPSCRRPTWHGSPRPLGPGAVAGGRRCRPGRDRARSPRASTPGCTSSRPTAGRWRASWPARSAGRWSPTRPASSPPRPRPSGSPTRRHGSARSRTRPAASGPLPRSRCRARRGRTRARCRSLDEPVIDMNDDDPVWDAIHRKRAIRAFADRPLEPAHLERILDAGASGRQLEELAALGVHRLSRPGPSARAVARRAVRRPSRRSGRRDRPRDARTRPRPTRRSRSCSTSARRPRT